MAALQVVAAAQTTKRVLRLERVALQAQNLAEPNARLQGSFRPVLAFASTPLPLPAGSSDGAKVGHFQPVD